MMTQQQITKEAVERINKYFEEMFAPIKDEISSFALTVGATQIAAHIASREESAIYAEHLEKQGFDVEKARELSFSGANINPKKFN